MRLFLVWLIGLGCLVVPGTPVPGELISVQNEKRWLSDYQTARKVASKSGKPMFVVFR
jgi:hypothetical protein